MLNLKRLATGAAALIMAAALPLGGLSARACMAPSPFADVTIEDFNNSPISWCYYEGLMQGVSDTEFGAESPVSRAMLATTLYRIDVLKAGLEVEGVPTAGSFSDVTAGSWYEIPVKWAKATGLINGVGENKFAPGVTITRQDLAVILYRRAGSPQLEISDLVLETLSDLKDYDSISGYAQNAMEWACGQNYLDTAPAEDGGLLIAPKAPVTRGDLADVLMKLTYDIQNPLYFNHEKVVSIVVTEGDSGDKVTLTAPDTIESFVRQFNAFEADGFRFPKPGAGWSYRVEVNGTLSCTGTTVFYCSGDLSTVTMTPCGVETTYYDPDMLPAPGGESKNIFAEYFRELPDKGTPPEDEIPDKGTPPEEE